MTFSFLIQIDEIVSDTIDRVIKLWADYVVADMCERDDLRLSIECILVSIIKCNLLSMSALWLCENLINFTSQLIFLFRATTSAILDL